MERLGSVKNAPKTPVSSSRLLSIVRCAKLETILESYCALWRWRSYVVSVEAIKVALSSNSHHDSTHD